MEFDDLSRRARGRRQFNLRRRAQQIERRRLVLEHLQTMDLRRLRGLAVRLAAQLGVHRSTVWRDIQALFCHSEDVPCPVCGNRVDRRIVQRAAEAGILWTFTEKKIKLRPAQGAKPGSP